MKAMQLRVPKVWLSSLGQLREQCGMGQHQSPIEAFALHGEPWDDGPDISPQGDTTA